MGTNRNTIPGGSSDPPRDPKAWLWLAVGLVLIIIFMFVMEPFKKIFPGMETMSAFIEERGIRATALYYTDIDEFGEAAASLRNTLEYSPASVQRPPQNP